MKKPARLFVVGIVFVALLVVVLLSAFALRWHGARQRADALLALNAAGQPVLPQDLGRIEDPRPEPTPWFAQLIAARMRWAPTELAQKTTYDALRARAARNELGAEAEAAFAALEACAGPDAASVVQAVLDVIAAHDGLVEPPQCGLEAVRLLALGTAPHVEVARLAAGYGPVDTGYVVATIEGANAAFPTLPITQAFALSDALEIEALRGLWSDRPELVPDLLRAQRDVARIFEGAQLLVGGQAAVFADQRMLGLLELALPRLPRDTDLAWLETELERIRPRARLAVACSGERAFGNRGFERFRSGADTCGKEIERILPLSLTISYDQATYIRTWSETIAGLEHAAFRRPASEPLGWADRELAPLTRTMTRMTRGIVASTDVLEARLVLARAALVAFRTDAKQLLEFVAKTSDPFDGKPIRCGFAEGGIVILWSVGTDGVDDGGSNDERDIVWRFRPR